MSKRKKQRAVRQYKVRKSFYCIINALTDWVQNRHSIKDCLINTKVDNPKVILDVNPALKRVVVLQILNLRKNTTVPNKKINYRTVERDQRYNITITLSPNNQTDY